MPSLFRFFSLLPLWLTHAIGCLMGWITWACSPTYRRRFAANSAQAGYRFAEVRAAVGHAGRMVAELPRLWLRDTPVNAMHGTEVVEAAWARGKGILFLTPHLGSFELSVQGAAARWSAQRGPITVLYRPARQPWLAQMMLTARNRSGIQAVPTTLAGVRQMIKALRRGEAVGLLPDQVPPQGQGLWAPFFGKNAYSMTLAARLALQTGATVVLARCERLPAGRGFVLFFEPLPAPLKPQLEQAVVQINEAMEHLIRQCPTQYLWGYGRYKQPRAEAPAPAEQGGEA
ncbi:MAG: lysophospholipid acyltransferase family protein [Hydrogenophaga sp.]|jgi:KDO2-lipid IV(A) lauroyltransferase|uniref:lysophospholipid acyltransferase family protein n=1 Tax=Hydrogenophaga sp. TaxID=1904254 RepID=UPI000EBC8FA7|nr:lysophospholipid acyltransferase family protein [Hydrogenophaga sp.]MDD3784273.1 lysophospholipid acyltransferase family protein [Hydrogenophaga sp.]MDX9969005.1 lysophospholipid acyltransferase family protein [Hydrogenophaga sp.]HAJ14225.1 lysophospholipid acyltransferase family protein [Comamonadaceae bacterium]